MSGYIKCPCDCYEPGSDGICFDSECGHDAHQHNAEVGPHEACLAQEGDEPGCYLPFEDDTTLPLPTRPIEAWVVICGVGGYVCAEPDADKPDGICGMPVESEPCDIIHHSLTRLEGS